MRNTHIGEFCITKSLLILREVLFMPTIESIPEVIEHSSLCSRTNFLMRNLRPMNVLCRAIPSIPLCMWLTFLWQHIVLFYLFLSQTVMPIDKVSTAVTNSKILRQLRSLCSIFGTCMLLSMCQNILRQIQNI